MKWTASMLFVMVVMVASCAHGKKGPELTRIDENKDASYEVMILPRGHGSGVVIHEDGYMITNHHVCGDGSRELRVNVTEDKGKPALHKAVVIGFDPEQDICVIKVDATFKHPAILEDIENVNEGDSVYNIGFPYSFGQLVDRGTVAKMRWNSPGLGLRNGIMVDLEFAHPGSSGSGVYLVRSGKLIGLVKMLAWRQAVRGKMKLPRMTVKILVGVDDIKKLLDKYGVPHRTSRDSNENWAVPKSGEPLGGYQIEIFQVK